MAVCKFCRAPSGLWCGVVEHNGGHIFSAGRTLDDLLKRIKNHAHTVTHGNLRCAQIYLDTKQYDPTEFADLYKVFMSVMFVSKFWLGKNPDKDVEPKYKTFYPNQKDKNDDAPKEDKPIKVTPTECDEHITQIVDGELRVYKLVEVARYKLHTDTSKKPEWPVNLDATKPVLPMYSESQEEKL